MAAEAIKWLDYGVDRLCRQPPFLPTYRQVGYDAHVEAITALLERQDGARDDDSTATPDG